MTGVNVPLGRARLLSPRDDDPRDPDDRFTSTPAVCCAQIPVVPQLRNDAALDAAAKTAFVSEWKATVRETGRDPRAFVGHAEVGIEESGLIRSP